MKYNMVRYLNNDAHTLLKNALYCMHFCILHMYTHTLCMLYMCYDIYNVYVEPSLLCLKCQGTVGESRCQARAQDNNHACIAYTTR